LTAQTKTMTEQSALINKRRLIQITALRDTYLSLVHFCVQASRKR
jgi:hypothetical protein